MKYNFLDDYSEGVHPEILRYITDHNDGQQLGYGHDAYCALAAHRITEAFGVPGADVHFLPNGTITNVTGLAAMLKPFEGVISPSTGHINVHEAGALEATGHKIIWVDSPDGKLTPDLIDEALSRYHDEHTVVPRAVYLTQPTELGTAYTKAELTEVVADAKRKGLLVYVDGARLPMALAVPALDLTPKEFGALGLDMFYVGGTKNGGLYGEALVITNPDLKPNFRHHMKQRGALMAKGRFMGLQFARLFDSDNLWLSLGDNANRQATRLHAGLQELGVKFDVEPVTNQLFPIMPDPLVKRLSEDFGFFEWQPLDDGHTMIRLVCSWATTSSHVDDFVAAVRSALALT
jgi:threonine aldolase